MSTCIAVFRSKTEVFAFMEKLKSNGVYCTIGSTPKEAHIGCGISVRFSSASLASAKKILSRSGLNSFFGIYEMTKYGQRTSVYRIM